MANLLVGMIKDIALGQITTFINTYVDEQYKYQTMDVKEMLRKMKDSLTPIEAVVCVAEAMEIEENPSLVRWLSELKNAIYNAEYVMDIFEYQRLKNEAEGWPYETIEEANDNEICLTSKVRRITDWSSDSSSKIKKSASVAVKRLFFDDEDLNDLKQIVDKFDTLEKQTNTFINLLQLHRPNPIFVAADQGPKSRETTSEPVETKLFGRDEEEKQLLEKLQSSNATETTCFSIVSIVGVGGVGKTTLAQSIFNHPSLEGKFDIKAWVCVSNNFSIKTLMKDIVETSRIDKPTDFHSLNTLNEIQKILKEGLQSKKFLVVLDDVWEDMKQDKWDKICLPFRNGNNGSKIIVTSRSRDVARGIGASDDMQVDLSPLRFGYYWEFFQKCAFRDENPENYPQLKDIGEEIACKLGCLPLAAKMVGGVLCKKLNVDHWRGILKGMPWKEQDFGIMSVLKLSYNQLPGHLKKCFLYCCLFPKDEGYKATTLVDIWIALDCVKPVDKNKRLADIQREYIDELVNRCFLDVKKIIDSYYTIHDLLHDLAESILGHEIYRVEDDEFLPNVMTHNVRHLYIKSTSNNISLDFVMQKLNIAPKQLRSLVYIIPGVKEVKEKFEMSEETSYKLKGLRFLFLHIHTSNVSQIFENVCNMRHLRCINYKVGEYSRPRHLVFPASFWKLHQLETLRWGLEDIASPKVEKWVPTNKLINLRHVDDIYSYGNPINFSYLGLLKSLEVIPGRMFRVDDKMGNDMGQLEQLDKIGGELYIEVHTKLSRTEAEKANLSRKLYLTKLYISDKEGIEAGAIEALQPPKSLEFLNIDGCSNITRAPHWLSKLSNLTKLYLEKLPNLQGLPPDLGWNLLVLKVLFLSYLSSMKQIDVGDAAVVLNDHRVLEFFPSLNYISISEMKIFKGWSLHSTIHNQTTIYLPKLCKIIIHACPMIGSSPKCTVILSPRSHTQNFHFIKLVVPFKPKGEEEEEEDEDEDKEMIEMVIDGESLIETAYCDDRRFFSRVKYLHFARKLDDGPLMSALQEKLSSVKTLRIEWFEELQSFDNYHITPHATTIKKLFIKHCNGLKFLFASGFFLQSLSSLETLVIVNCDKLESLTEHQPWNASSLKTLIIKNCKKLRFLYANFSCSSLEKLIIKHCDELESLTGGNVDNHDQNNLLLPVSIKTMSIVNCNKLKLPPTPVLMLLNDERVNI